MIFDFLRFYSVSMVFTLRLIGNYSAISLHLIGDFYIKCHSDLVSEPLLMIFPLRRNEVIRFEILFFF